MSKHHIIKLSLCDYVSLFFSNVFGCLCCKCCFKKKDKLTHLYEESEEKLANQLDIIKIVQNMQKMKLMLRSSMMTQEIETQMQHSKKFVIDLDASDEESEDDTHDVNKQIAQKDGTVAPDFEPNSRNQNGNKTADLGLGSAQTNTRGASPEVESEHPK